MPFKVKFEDGKVLNLNRPKMKAYKMVVGMSRSMDENQFEDMFDEISEVIAYVLSNNKEKKKIDSNFVCEHFEITDVIKFLTEYLNWANGMINDPN